ncbi:MAG TPA: GAF domain-containing SpoIIE family protein phosphatase [Propionibacteriaceae bacterium]
MPLPAVVSPGEALWAPADLISTSSLTTPGEEARLQALEALQLMDTPPEERFDLVVRLTQRLFGVSSVAVSLIESDRQWLKSKVGTDYCEGPRNEAMCNYTIRQSGPLVVPDATADERFRDLPGVTAPGGVRFYAGQPLEAPGGYRVGTLCMWDSQPRELTQDDLKLLRDLAAWVEKELVVDADLAQASAVQRALLPSRAPALKGFDVAGRCYPARHVGGDFYDYYLLGDKLQFSIADVMGKGVPAALVAAGVRSVLRGANRFNDVAEAVNRVAYSLEQDLTETATFVTLFSGRLDPATGALTYVDAGHGLSGIVRHSGAVQQLASLAPPLGAVLGWEWQQQYAELAPGDTFVSVSDGWLDFFETVQDAATAVVRVVLESSTAQEVVDHIGRVSGKETLLDDLTVVVVRRKLSRDV